MWWFLACTAAPSGLDTPIALEGDGVHAVVRSEWGWQGGQTRVGLWAERFGTDGEVLADVVSDPDGSIWLYFAVQTGLGEAVSALRLEGDSGVLPLGERPGEDVLRLRKTSLDEVKLAGAQVASKTGIGAARSAWEAGVFVLKQSGATVGELRFRGDAPPLVGVYDQWWLTPRPMEASVVARGAELVLGFDVEPSLRGEGALLRVNVPLQTAVAPIGDVPVDEERRFVLVPGHLDEGARDALKAEAISASDRREAATVQEQAKSLGRAAAQENGGCAQWDEMKTDWGLIFAGYELDIAPTLTGCAVSVETGRRQHGRRFKGRVMP
jgi:hypothetical protein